MKAKNQRLVLLGLALVALVGAAILAMSAMRDQASFFYAPADVARQGLPLDRAVRIGGMVRRGSLHRHPDGVTIDFLVGDETPATIAVTYRGITPDLFREGSGVIAAYGIALVGTAALTLWSWIAMRRAEAEADALGRRP